MATRRSYKITRSNIHNRGAFATRCIPEEERIVEYKGEKITKAESLRRGAKWEEKAKKQNKGLVYIFELNKRHDIDGSVGYNPAKYFNHSCEPNCTAVKIRGHIWLIALRNIEEGEELTYDYGYDLEHFLEHPCHCNTPSCLGYIVGKEHRAKARRLAKKTPL